MEFRWTDASVSSVCLRSSVETLPEDISAIDHDGGDIKQKQKQQQQNDSPAMLIYPPKIFSGLNSFLV